MSEPAIHYIVGGPKCLLDPCIDATKLARALTIMAPVAGKLSADRHRRAVSVLQRAQPEIAHCLQQQAWCYDDGRHRRVELWGMVEISVGNDGTGLQARYLDNELEAGRYVAAANLTRPLGGFAFALAFMPLLVRASREEKLDPRRLVGPTGDWLRSAIRAACRGLVDWKRLRRSVLAFLRPDPLVLSLLRRIFVGGNPDIDAFDWVARHVRELALIAVEHPRLLPFMQLVQPRGEGSLVPRLDRWLGDAGLTPSARRKLETWGYPPFDQVCELALFQDPAETMARYANLLDRLQVAYEPPEMFTQLAGVAAPFAPDWFHRALLAEIESLALDAPDDPYPEEFDAALRWVASGPPAPDANQQRAGWPWIASQAWQHNLASHESVRKPWATPIGAFEESGYRVVPVRNLADLHEEALEMRNCLDRYAAACASGSVAVFSVRGLDGRRAGCFALQRAAPPVHWALLQVAGKANREPDALMSRIAATTAEACSVF